MKIIDLHCDTLYKFKSVNGYSFKNNNGHITENTLIKGDYMAQCFAAYIPANLMGEDAYTYFSASINDFEKNILTAKIKKAKNGKQIIENNNNGFVSAVLTVENAEPLNGSINRVNEFVNHNVRLLGLVHNGENCIGFPHNNSCEGLKQFGKDVVEALNETDITVDVAHLNKKGFSDVADISKKPFVSSHSACDALCHHTRNLTDHQIRAIAKSGGVVGIPFYAAFLNGGTKTEICDIIRHLEHLINTGGEDIAALGTDFDGMTCDLFLKDCSEMPRIANEIIKKFGFNLAEKICYKNALRII